MKLSLHCHFTQKIIAVLLAFSPLFAPAWADQNGTKPTPRQRAVKVSSKNLESPKRPIPPYSLVIEEVQATGVDLHVQVRVIGRGNLSCVPFRLDDPNRLVLDCSGAHVQVQQTPIRVDLEPVRSVRVGPFKSGVARVVVELTGQPPYSIRADGNTVVVTFDSIHRQLSGLESRSKQVESATSPVKGQDEQVASTLVPMVPENLPVTKHAEVTSAGPTIDEVLSPHQSASTSLAPRPDPVVSSNPPGVQETGAEAGTPMEKLDSTPDQDYVIGPQDLLAINVWHEPELSQSVPVRPDGKISLPLVGDLEVSGLTPRLLQARLAKELDVYIHKPQVTVIVREVNSRKFYIIGQVERPGTYSLSAHLTVLDALATAGGFRDFAKVQQIYLLRLMPDGARKRFHFDYKAAVNGKNSYRDIELQTGDTLVVP